MRSLRTAAFLLAVLTGWPQASADEVQTDLDSTEWTCGAKIALPGKHLEDIVKAAEIVGGKGAGGNGFLILRVPDMSDVMFGGVVLAVKTGGAWKTYAIESGGGVQGAMATADGKDQLLVTMLSRGDPGSSYTVVAGENGFSTFTCAEVAFPDALNNPDWRGEYLQLDAVNGQGGGHLTLDGHALRDIDGAEATDYYRFESKDGGKTWSAPQRFAAAPGKVSGDFSSIGAAPDLVAYFVANAR